MPKTLLMSRLILRHWPIALFAVLSLLITVTRLFGGEWVFGREGADITLEFLSWREFGFAEMRAGHFPLWNPYIFCGVPYFAGFQSALLYPPNWLHLIFSPATAINWTVAIHLFLAGWLMFRWCKSGGTSATAATLAGVCWMFSGPFYLRIFAGHLSILCLIPWVPLLWEAIDRAFRKPSLRAVLPGGFALAMMILAGHPQYVYFAGVVTAPYVLLKWRDVSSWKLRLRATGVCIAIVLAGAAITAVQWLTALDANGELVRSVGLDYPTAASFSLPPENFWTLVAPNLFGTLALTDSPTPPGYFGRAYLWEVSLYMSVAGFTLALIGMIHSVLRRDLKWIALLLLCGLLALGAHTPLHRFLYDYLPGFGSFRGVSKFSFLLLMILCKLAADGWDALADVRGRRIGIVAGSVVTLTLLILWGVTFSGIGEGKHSLWAHSLRDHLEAAVDAQEYFLEPRLLARDDFFNEAARISARSALIAAGVSIAVLGCIFAARWASRARCALVAIASIEMLTFAFRHRAISTARRDIPEQWKPAITALPADARILTPEWQQEDWSMSWRVANVWGYDPNVQLRFAQLMYASQGLPVEQARNYIAFRGMPTSIRRMLRVGAVLLNRQSPPFVMSPDPLPVASLVTLPFIMKDRVELLKLVVSDQFDPQFSVALESPPPFELSRSFEPGTVKVLGSGTDFLEVDADVKAAAVMLITNSYSRHWKVTSILSPQATFEVMPANWTLMGIPLKPGRHHLRIEYAPTSFTIGVWVSVISTGAFLAGAGWQIFSRHRRGSSDN